MGSISLNRSHCAKNLPSANGRVSATGRSLVQMSPTECVRVMECDEVQQ